MIKVNVKTPDLNKITEKLNKLIDQKFVADVNSDVVPVIKDLITSGQSPVSGYGRFQQYKDKNKYPGARKPSSPVNLTLSGLMLSLYKARFVNGKTLGIGYDGSDDKLNGQIIGNNEGMRGIPKRRFIPQNGESFTISVMRKIKDLYAKRISTLFS